MKQFNFKVYKGNMQYLLFFDAMFREKQINKEFYLLDNNITPSSYRRARVAEHKIGKEIVLKISKNFGYQLTPKNVVDELEKLATKIYHAMNYKIFNSYEEDLKYLKELHKENYLINPVIELLILFLNINSNKSVKIIIPENLELYKKVKNYKPFFTDELLIIFDLTNIYFEGEYDEELRMRKYDNAIAYFILSSQSFRKERYVEALYYGYMSRNICEKEGSIKRVIYINEIIMSSLLHIGSYEECYNLSYRQILILESLGIDDNVMKFAKKFLIVALFGMKEYEQIIEILKNRQTFNLTEMTCLLVSKFYTNRKEYDRFLNEGIDYEMFDNNSLIYIKNLSKFLIKKDKKVLSELENNKIMLPVIKILKKL